LLRQWAGQDAAIAQRDTEIQRLERLVWDAVYALQKAGLDKEREYDGDPADVSALRLAHERR
jgi:hypothetical protein